MSYQLDIGSLSDKGRVRPSNEDCIGLYSNIHNEDFIAVLADGMGGCLAGEVASKMLVGGFEKNFYLQLNKLHSPEEALSHVIKQANSEILSLSQQSLEYRGMGTTSVVLFLHESVAYFDNTGDSRLYLKRDHTILQLSTDHTYVADLLKQGLIDKKLARKHPNRNIITRAIGTSEDVPIKTKKLAARIKVGDSFLLCSDGLHDLVDDLEILESLSKYKAQEACQKLVGLANSRGGYDNN